MGLLDDAIREHLELKRRRGADPTEVEREEREVLGPVHRRGVDPVDAELEFAHPAPDEPHEDVSWANGDSEHASDDARPHTAATAFDHEQLTDPAPRFSEPLAEPVPRPEPEQFAEPARSPEAEQFADPARSPEPEQFAEPARSPEPGQFAEPARGPEPVRWPRPDPAAARREPEPHPAPPQEPERAPYPEAAPHEPESHPTVAHESVADAEHEPSEDGQSTVEYDLEQEEHQPKEGEREDVLEETPEFLQDTPDHDRLWFEQRPPRDFDFDG